MFSEVITLDNLCAGDSVLLLPIHISKQWSQIMRKQPFERCYPSQSDNSSFWASTSVISLPNKWYLWQRVVHCTRDIKSVFGCLDCHLPSKGIPKDSGNLSSVECSLLHLCIFQMSCMSNHVEQVRCLCISVPTMPPMHSPLCTPTRQLAKKQSKVLAA